MQYMNMDAFATLCETRDALRARKLSATELVQAQIARIEALDGKLNALVVRCFDRALAQARDSDRRLVTGSARPLEGVPVTIKEGINVSGLPTTVGDSGYRDFISQHDAPTVRRLREAGAVILGKTNVPPEMADWQAANAVYGRTNNPWDLTRTCGGSSGGGAALAAGFGTLDIGSDIGGSIRVPAAFCGVYGLRPSETLVPRSGQYPIPPTPNWGAVLGAQGPIARSAADIETALEVIAGPDVGEDRAWRVELPAPRCTSLKGARIAVLRGPDYAPVDAELLSAQQRMADTLARAGARVDVAHPEEFGDWREHYRLYLHLLHYMMSPRWDADKRELAIARLREDDDEFAPAQIDGLRCTGAQLFMWHLARERVRATWRRFFADWDAVIAPAFHTPAFAHVEFDTAALGLGATRTRIDVDGVRVPYTRGLFYPHLSTLAGQPALAIPAGISRKKLPLAVQLIGPYLEDLTLTRLASLIAQEVGGFVPPPPWD